MSEDTKKKVIKEADVVRRIQGTPIRGVVTSIRNDSGGGASSRGERGVMIGVKWDNGSFSYFVPDSLEVVGK